MNHRTQYPAPEAQIDTVNQPPGSLTLDAYNPQLQSPLFSTIPAEIRNAIFSLALLEYEDPAQPYDFQSYYYRPGYRCRRRLNTALLRTCRRINLETRHFGGGWDKRIPLERRMTDAVAYQDPYRMRHLSAEDRKKLEHVHVFAQLFWWEDISLTELLTLNGLAPKKITITIRYTDWWSWESDAVPHFDDRCFIRSLEAPASVEEFVVEFETLEKKKAQLEDLLRLEGILELPIKRMDGIEMRTQGCQLRSKTWTGTAVFDGDRFEHHGEGETIEYYVVTATWRPYKGLSRVPSLQGL